MGGGEEGVWKNSISKMSHRIKKGMSGEGIGGLGLETRWGAWGLERGLGTRRLPIVFLSSLPKWLIARRIMDENEPNKKCLVENEQTFTLRIKASSFTEMFVLTCLSGKKLNPRENPPLTHFP